MTAHAVADRIRTWASRERTSPEAATPASGAIGTLTQVYKVARATGQELVISHDGGGVRVDVEESGVGVYMVEGIRGHWERRKASVVGEVIWTELEDGRKGRKRPWDWGPVKVGESNETLECLQSISLV